MNDNFQGLGEEKNVNLLFNEYRVLGLQVETTSGDWLKNNVDVLNTTELYTLKWLRW